jgi:hypothetical protein
LTGHRAARIIRGVSAFDVVLTVLVLGAVVDHGQGSGGF